RQWDERGRPRGLLWRGEALADYRRWRSRWSGAEGGVELAFAQASLADAARARRARTLLVAASFLVLLVMVVILARASRRAAANAADAHAREYEAYAEQGRQLFLSGDAVRALPFLVEALKERDQDPALRYLIARALQIVRAERQVLRHGGFVSAVAFSHDRA